MTSHNSPRPANIALRPPARLDSAPQSPIGPGSLTSSSSRFNTAFNALPSSVSRHASQASISSIASDASLLDNHDVHSPSNDHAFAALQRELNGTDAGPRSIADSPRGGFSSSAREGTRFFEEPEQLDTLRGASHAREQNGARSRSNGSSGDAQPALPSSSSSSVDLEHGRANLQPQASTSHDAPRSRERRPGERIFPAPLLLKSDRSYSSGGGGAASSSSSPYFAPTAPLSIPRRPSASSAAASGMVGVSPGLPSSRRDGMMGPPSSNDVSRSTLPYQRHRQQQSSTSSLSHGSYLPYNSSYSYEPRQQPAYSAASDAQPPTSGNGRHPTPPSTGLSASTTSLNPSAVPSPSEPPISAQALLLDVLSLRSAASPMSLSQSQGPLSRSTTPLLTAGHQRIRSAGSSGSAERGAADGSARAPSSSADDRSPSRSATGGTYHGGPKLDTVDLSHKRIADIPIEIVNELKDEVEKLALGYNLLKDLPPHFSQLGSRLKYLNIRVNLLTTFPTVLCDMPSIEILDISRNKIRKLPPNPGTLVNLKVFSIAKNRIKRLPTWFTQMTHLKVLKLDHNPLDWPPREVATFPASVSGLPMSKQEEADEMQKWLPALLRWMRDNREREVERERERESEKRRRPSLAAASEDEHGARAGGSMSRTQSGRLQTSPRIPSTESISRSRTAQTLPSTLETGLSGSASDYLDADPSIRHSRNASHSTTQGLAIPSRSGLRAKKSLPDLRQSHADILAERRSGTTLDEEPASQPSVPALDTALRRVLDERPAGPSHTASASAALPSQVGATIVRPDSARPTTPTPSVSPIPRKGTAPPLQAVAQTPFDKGKRPEVDRSGVSDFERNSGAYFRRLSMLPASTIAKTVPVALLQFADAIRGILFALSQVHAALRQFVVFASQDRLPAPLGRLMGSADSSVSALINALDRFDSLSRRGTPPAATVKSVFVACRDTVDLFGALVSALQPQLAALTATADARYTRTLVLMLYGTVGELAASWSSVAALLASSEDPSLAKLVLQPPTPSPHNDLGARIDPAPPRITRQRSVTRRHAGSFSVEDVQLGANLPPADIPPVPALPGGALMFDESATTTESNGNSTMRNRPPLSGKTSASSAISLRAGPPPPLAMPAQLGYEAMVQKAFEHPITPGGLFNASGDSRAPSRAGSISGPSGIPPLPSMPSSGTLASGSALQAAVAAPTGGLPSAAFHPHRISRPVSTLNADETFVDTADSTVSIASDVYGMLLDSFEDPAALSSQFAVIGKRRLKELTELCQAGYDSTARLQRAIERVRGNDGRGRLKFTAHDARKLGDASFEFVQNVIRAAKLIKSVSLDFAFSQQMREGIGQLTLGTREFARLLTTSHTSFRPARMVLGEGAGGSSGNGAGEGEEARGGGGGGEVRPRDFA
ncbi:uncharacterized protein JCM10292_003627 [Rhodotorula paludigena]|uniref:uncharacterized protein n=1 Tax=Rhodotorula paludigena TaxID=86838 RepID=UPI00317DD128